MISSKFKFSDGKVWQASFAQVFSRILALISNFAIIAILARTLSASDFGAWAVLVNIFQIILALDLGLGGALRNKVSDHVLRNEEDTVRLYATSLFLFLLILLIIIIGAGSFMDLSESVGLGDKYHNSLVHAVIAGAFIVPAGMLGQLLYCYLEGVWIAYVEALRSIVVIASIYLAVAFDFSFSSILSIYFFVFLTFYILLVGIFLYKRRWNLFRSIAQHSFNKFIVNIKELIAPAWLLSLMQIASMISGNVSTIMVGKYLSLEEAGEFSAVFRLYSSATGLHLAFLMPFWGAFALKHAELDYPWIKRMVVLLTTVTFTLCALFSLSMFYYGYLVVNIWTSLSITDSSLYFYSSVWMTLTMIATIYGIYLNATGQYLIQTFAQVASAIFIVLTTKYFSANYGVNGVIFSLIAGAFIVCSLNIAAYKVYINRKSAAIY